MSPVVYKSSRRSMLHTYRAGARPCHPSLPFVDGGVIHTAFWGFLRVYGGFLVLLVVNPHILLALSTVVISVLAPTSVHTSQIPAQGASFLAQYWRGRAHRARGSFGAR